MQKSLKEEIKYLERRLNENQDSILFARLADAYLQVGRLDEAIELCERGVRIHPEYITGHFVLGKCYLQKKLNDQAEREFEKVITKDPKYIAAHREFGELMAQIGQTLKFERHYDEILNIDPLNDKARQRQVELKNQFSIQPKQASILEQELDFQPAQEDQDMFSQPYFPPEDAEPVQKSEIEKEEDYELAQPPISEETDESPTNELEDVDKNIDLLEDIFGDNNVENLDIAPPGFTEKKSVESFEAEAPLERQTPEKDMPQQPPIVPNIPPEPDPFYQLQKQRESEQDEVDTFGFPVEHKLKEPDFVQPPQKEEPTSFSDLEPIRADDDQTKAEQKDKTKPKKEKIVTPTLGEIYAAQHQYPKAIGVYELLLKKDPNNEMYKKKIEILRQKLEESEDD